MLHLECGAGTLHGHSRSAPLFPYSLPPRSSQALYTEDTESPTPLAWSVGGEEDLRVVIESAQGRGCPAEQSGCLGWEERPASLSSLKRAASNKAAGAQPGSLRLRVMETLSSAEQASRRSPGPGEFGCLLCPGGNSGCLAQSQPTLSQKLALMRVMGPISFQGCALKQHEAESRSSFPGEMLRMHKAEASPLPPLPNHLLAELSLSSRLLFQCFPLPQMAYRLTSLAPILPRPAQILFKFYLCLNPHEWRLS